jgi:hypothetical protein
MLLDMVTPSGPGIVPAHSPSSRVTAPTRANGPERRCEQPEKIQSGTLRRSDCEDRQRSLKVLGCGW